MGSTWGRQDDANEQADSLVVPSWTASSRAGWRLPLDLADSHGQLVHDQLPPCPFELSSCSLPLRHSAFTPNSSSTTNATSPSNTSSNTTYRADWLLGEDMDTNRRS